MLPATEVTTMLPSGLGTPSAQYESMHTQDTDTDRQENSDAQTLQEQERPDQIQCLTPQQQPRLGQ